MKKTIDFHIRIDVDTFTKVQLLAEHYKTDKSKLLRKWIEETYNRIESDGE